MHSTARIINNLHGAHLMSAPDCELTRDSDRKNVHRLGDMDFVITYWNLGAQELYGWAAKDAIGKDSQQLLQTEFPAPLEDVRTELLRAGRWEGELTRTTAHGIQVVVAGRWALRRDEQGRAVAILETNNDITERKRREQEIQSLNQELAKRSTDLEFINKELEA